MTVTGQCFLRQWIVINAGVVTDTASGTHAKFVEFLTSKPGKNSSGAKVERWSPNRDGLITGGGSTVIAGL